MMNDSKALLFDEGSESSKVRNGRAYEKAELDASGFDAIVVPEGAKVVQGGRSDALEIFVEKVLSFKGHPPSPMSLLDAISYMGIATRLEVRTLLLGTYGEFSTKEGGASIRLLIKIPARLKLERRSGLSGYPSSAQDPRESSGLPDAKSLEKCYWYGPVRPKKGWDSLKMSLDAARNAGSTT